jgi:predicted DNA-binding transcriptional regulator AlpA
MTDKTPAAPAMAWHSTPSKITGLTAAQLRRAVKAGQLPPPVKVGERLRGWKVSDLLALIATPTA